MKRILKFFWALRFSLWRVNCNIKQLFLICILTKFSATKLHFANKPSHNVQNILAQITTKTITKSTALPAIQSKDLSTLAFFLNDSV